MSLNLLGVYFLSILKYDLWLDKGKKSHKQRYVYRLNIYCFRQSISGSVLFGSPPPPWVLFTFLHTSSTLVGASSSKLLSNNIFLPKISLVVIFSRPIPQCFIYILMARPSSGPRAVVNRLGREADKWKRQVQVQRSSVYDTHSMLNWWQDSVWRRQVQRSSVYVTHSMLNWWQEDSVEAAGPGRAIQRLRHTLHAQLMAGQCGHSEGFQGSVADPDPSDPYVFGPLGPGSGSISQSYGSGSFYHQAKIGRKNLSSYCFLTSFRLFFLWKMI